MGIRFENLEVYGFEAAIRGMRNPKNSWDKSDSGKVQYRICGITRGNPERICSCVLDANNCTESDSFVTTEFYIGENDLKLMNALFKAGSDHRKFMRFINVTVDIIAPLYWWKEFDTYKVGTVANSCSTMHKIAAKPFELDDFSYDNLFGDSIDCLDSVIHKLNEYRKRFNETKNKGDWWQMIQLLPSSYNQRRTIQMNYEVLANINRTGRRKDHKLDEWRTFCEWVDCLPYYAGITKCS